MSDSKTLSVTRLVRRMRNLLEIELGEVWVEGEVSNLRKQASGHMYFTLKDEGAQLSCVLFRGNVRNAKVLPDNGMKVKLYGDVSLYEARGTLQLIVKKVEGVGEGELQAKFEALKKKLDSEGLFDEERKKPLPSFPESIGLITSGSGAALQDMLNVLGRRAPWVQPYLYPVQVQGAGAEIGIAQAIQQWSDWEKHDLPKVDVIIIGRGGGSLEDLWNFNEEVVARAIADCDIPIISAVGHEIDFTISDFVADMRAPTPSAAAELAVPDGEALMARVHRCDSQMKRIIESEFQRCEITLQGMKRGVLSQSSDRVLREPYQRVQQARKDMDDSVYYAVQRKNDELKELALRLEAQRPIKVLERRLEKLNHLRHSLDHLKDEQIARKQQQLARYASMLRTLGPESVLARGYSVTLTEDGKLVNDPAQLKEGQEIRTKVAKGDFVSTVKKDS